MNAPPRCGNAPVARGAGEAAQQTAGTAKRSDDARTAQVFRAAPPRRGPQQVAQPEPPAGTEAALDLMAALREWGRP
jgi:hypothetical protein